MGFLQGKKLLITGVLSNRSIAYGIAQACRREGAELAFTYVGERFHDRVNAFAQEFGSDICLEMDVSKDDQISAVALPATSWKASRGKPSRRQWTSLPTPTQLWQRPLCL